MSSSSDRGPRPGPLDVAVLKSWDFGAWERLHGAGQLPYRMDHLERSGIRLHWTDRFHDERASRSRVAAAIRRVESATVPFAQAAVMSGQIRRCSATLAMFESEANGLAALRSIWPRGKRSPLVVVSCWLTQILAGAGRSKTAAYRRAYDSVDVLYYLSRNQGPALEEALGLRGDRLRYLPFGVDTETFKPADAPDGGYVLAVGRDRARDWPTLFEAVRPLDMKVKVCCRPSQIEGMAVPPNVEVLGYVQRDRYRELLGAATVVAVLTRPVGYPSGQSVLLEAMAMGRTVVATQTDALAEYLDDGTDCLTVPASDPAAARERIDRAVRDGELRARIGVQARRTAASRYDSSIMWGTVAQDLHRLAGD